MKIDEIINTFNLEAQSRKVQLKIESDNDVPSRICTDFEKLKFILTIVIQNYMNFIKEGQNIIISIKNQSNQSDEHDLSYINETQNIIQNKNNSFLIQFSIYLWSPLFNQVGAESVRIQQVFTQSLKSSVDSVDFHKQFQFSNQQINQNYQGNTNQQVNISRKSSFFKSKPVVQPKIDKIFEQINSVQVSNMIAQKLVSQTPNQSSLKNSIKQQNGLQFEKTEKGLPCITFLVENQQQNAQERENTLKLTQNGDSSTNHLNRQTTDGLSPIYYSQRTPIRPKLDIDNHEEEELDAQIQIDLNPQKIQQVGLHSFPKTKSLSHLQSNDSRKLSMISNLCSTNELLRAEENGNLDVTHPYFINFHKRISTNPKSLIGLPIDFQAAATTAQSTFNQEDLDENHLIQNKPNNKIPKLENIPELLVLEQSRDNGQPQQEETEMKQMKLNYANNTSPRKSPFNINYNKGNVLQPQEIALNFNDKMNKDTFLQNKYLTFNKKANDSSFSIHSPPKKCNDIDYYSYKDLPSSLSLSPRVQLPSNQQQEDILNYKDQNLNMFSPQDSILYQQSRDFHSKQENKKGDQNQSDQKQVLQKKSVDQLFTTSHQQTQDIQLGESQQARGISFGQEINQNYNGLTSGNTGRGEQSSTACNQTTPLFTAQQSRLPPQQLEIARTIKQTFTQTIPNSLLQKKQILFVDKHQLYHNQFQQVLSQYAKENEDETFQSAYTVEECISFIEGQYQQNKYQYPYIFIDYQMLNDGNSLLTESIKQISLIVKIPLQSQIFVCSNQFIDPSSISNYGITAVLKKPITLKEFEDNRIILFKKPYNTTNTTIISQSFSHLLQNNGPIQ